MAKCKACNAEIRWATTENGKKVPLDAATTTVFVVSGRGENGDPPPAITVPGHLSHFATCPEADRFRKKR